MEINNFEYIFGQKIFGLEFGPLGPPKKPTFGMKHFWKKVKKVEIIRVYFLHFFFRSPRSPLKNLLFERSILGKKVKKVDPTYFSILGGSTFFTFFQKCLIQKVGFLGGPRGPNSTPKFWCILY